MAASARPDASRLGVGGGPLTLPRDAGDVPDWVRPSAHSAAGWRPLLARSRRAAAGRKPGRRVDASSARPWASNSARRGFWSARGHLRSCWLAARPGHCLSPQPASGGRRQAITADEVLQTEGDAWTSSSTTATRLSPPGNGRARMGWRGGRSGRIVSRELLTRMSSCLVVFVHRQHVPQSDGGSPQKLLAQRLGCRRTTWPIAVTCVGGGCQRRPAARRPMRPSPSFRNSAAITPPCQPASQPRAGGTGRYLLADRWTPPAAGTTLSPQRLPRTTPLPQAATSPIRSAVGPTPTVRPEQILATSRPWSRRYTPHEVALGSDHRG